ncbi:MAG: entericidin A/B family lipoprotein [Rickettsiales bacterium]
MTKTILAALAVLALLTACETMEGLGRDTQKLGNNISNAAERND